MAYLTLFLLLFSLLAVPVCLLVFLIRTLRKKKLKVSLLALLCSLVLFAASCLLFVQVLGEPPLGSSSAADTASPFREAADKLLSLLPSPKQTQKPTDNTSNSTDDGSKPLTGLQMHMLDVGQGLSILLQADGETLLYDGGGRETSSYVVSYLQKTAKVESIELLVTSHYDEDHIAGLVGVLKSRFFQVETILNPDYETDTEIYKSYRKAVKTSGAKVIHPQPGSVFSVGNARVTVLAPQNTEAQNENDRSLVLRIDYGNTSYLLMGDAETAEEETILQSGGSVDADLLVIGHHGSAASCSERFVRAVSPAYALLSCGLGNSYGHPAQKTLDTLIRNRTKLYRTDIQGEVVASSDGKTITFNQNPCPIWESGEVLGYGKQRSPFESIAFSLPVLSHQAFSALRTRLFPMSLYSTNKSCYAEWAVGRRKAGRAGQPQGRTTSPVLREAPAIGALSQ